MQTISRGRLALWAGALAISLGVVVEPLQAQWAQVHEQFYLPARHNWVFRRNYPAADKLFNAFDYGHAILYEKLYTRPDAPPSELEEKEYDFITRTLLVRPPHVPLEEGAIEIAYVKLAPEAKAMFEWAHILHRQIYDVLGDERLSQAEKDAEVAELVRYYRSRPEVAFSSRPKNMELMEGQYYSTAFRDEYPKFNGLIWGYHWLQVGLYEPLMIGRSLDERQTGVAATVTRFRQMLEDAPTNMPRLMPMTAAIAPTFAARYPEAAIIFDNLHSMHDVISDILASDSVPRDRKREEILRAAQRYRDDTSFVMTEQEWREMSQMMGVQNMGGPVTGFLAGFPQPRVERGAVMAGGGMAGMDHGAMRTAPAAGAQGGAMQGMDHSAMGGMHPQAGAAQGIALGSGMGASMNTELTMEMHQRMMSDPVIRERVSSDPVLQRMIQGMPGMSPDDTGGVVSGTTARITPEAIDFIVRLLSDPQVESRIHSDPRLHQLWSDPAVQRRLAELRAQPRGPAAPGTSAAPMKPAAPAPTAPVQHQH